MTYAVGWRGVNGERGSQRAREGYQVGATFMRSMAYYIGPEIWGPPGQCVFRYGFIHSPSTPRSGIQKLNRLKLHG